MEVIGATLLHLRRNAGLTEVVQAPSPNTTLLIDGEVVVEAREDANDLVFGQGDGTGSQGFELVAVDETAAEFAVVTGPPGVDVAGAC